MYTHQLFPLRFIPERGIVLQMVERLHCMHTLWLLYVESVDAVASPIVILSRA
jgi:hypothetical protein